MRKRWFVVVMLFLLLPWLMVGCGVAQEEYDAAVSDLGKIQQELQSTKTELEAVQTEKANLIAENKSLKADYDAAQAKVSELTSSLGKSQTELSTIQNELEATEAKNSELTSSLGKSQSTLARIKTENEVLEEANAKLKRLIFLKTALCSEQPEAWNPKPQPDNTFKTNKEVWVYAEFTGWKYILVGQEIKRNIIVTIDILDFASGEVVESKSWTYTEKQELPYSRSGFDRSFGPLEVGNYTVQVKVEDHNSGEMITWEEEFQVVSS